MARVEARHTEPREVVRRKAPAGAAHHKALVEGARRKAVAEVHRMAVAGARRRAVGHTETVERHKAGLREAAGNLEQEVAEGSTGRPEEAESHTGSVVEGSAGSIPRPEEAGRKAGSLGKTLRFELALRLLQEGELGGG
jgi:hypothetical protein